MRLVKPLILASRSPRRILLLNMIGLSAEVKPCDSPEDFDAGRSPLENALDLAAGKARCVAERTANGYVVGADTIVIVDGTMLGKPVDETDARRMLRLLSNRTHTVITAFAVVDRPSGREVRDAEQTRVTFRELPDDEINEYVAGGSPMDKAGAYGIQDDYGAVFVERIEGCFYNVVGLPLSKFYTTLMNFQNQPA